MTEKQRTAITPTRADNYSEWYLSVIQAADMAENSSVRGCMVIKPYGYGIWEQMQRILDGMIKERGHENLYFPLFIPLSHLEKEAKHVEGFATECAVVTHHRLKKSPEGKLIPEGALEEPLVVRPTSETLIGESFARWIQSYRDLPILINQWANVVRWEMRTRLFLRTTEFLWQEGHTAHATPEEAQLETRLMLECYRLFVEETLAIPVIAGRKSESERFPGAVETYCIEALMQDNKALQAGTSHFLGQNFAKALNIQFLNPQGILEHVWTTSWGVSTRLIGGLIMTHSDDDGLMVPPKVAPYQVVILPIIHDESNRTVIVEACQQLAKSLQGKTYAGQPIRVKIDQRDLRGGDKLWSWVKKGVPIRLEIGARECEAKQVTLGFRVQPAKQRETMSQEACIERVSEWLMDIQNTLYTRAKERRDANTQVISTKEAFYEYFEHSNGFVLAHWNGNSALEAQLKQDLGVTIRCLPLDQENQPGHCIFTGQASAQLALFARAY